MLVVGVWVLERLAANREQFRPMKAIVSVGVLTGLASLAWWILYNKGIWSFKTLFANREDYSVDAVALASPPVFIAAIIMVIVLLAMISFRRNKIHILALPVITLMLVSLAADAGRMQAHRYGLYYREVAAAITMLDQPGEKVHIYYEGNTLHDLVQERMSFWGVKQKQITAEAVSYKNGIRFASLPYPTLLFTGVRFDLKPLREFSVDNNVCYIYRIDGIDPRTFQPRILDFKPRSIASSALVPRGPLSAGVIEFRYTSASSVAYISLDGRPLKTVLGQDGAGSAMISRELIGKPRTAKLRLCDPFTNAVSDPVDLHIAQSGGK
jgi:hypothetical protein